MQHTTLPDGRSVPDFSAPATHEELRALAMALCDYTGREWNVIANDEDHWVRLAPPKDRLREVWVVGPDASDLNFFANRLREEYGVMDLEEGFSGLTIPGYAVPLLTENLRWHVSQSGQSS
jgi:hypothetical protein